MQPASANNSGRLIVLRGLPGSGKSTLARALASRIGAVVLDKDSVRSALFPGDTTEYTTAQDDFVMGLLLQACGYHLTRGRSVIVDGRTHALRSQIALVREYASRVGAECVVLECRVSVDVALARVAADRAAGVHPAKNRDTALVHAQIAKWESADGQVLVLDMERPVADSVAEALSYLDAARYH